MKNYKFALVFAAALSLASCAQKARIAGTVADVPDGQVIVKQLNINSYKVLDTVKTDAAGRFKYALDVQKGQPEFVYLFHGDTRIAGMLLEAGESVTVKADTLGNYEVSGSEGSEKLAVVDRANADFMKAIYAATDVNEASRLYVGHYRESVKYVLENPFSLTVVPVLFERFGANSPLFSQVTDAILFKNAADSLETRYPESAYVKALRQEADRRAQALEINTMLQDAEELGYPDITYPDIKGQRQSLRALPGKVKLLHFWDATDAVQCMMNIETLMPLYNEFHDKGFDIYSVGMSADKSAWGSVVTSQNLPWTNVSGGIAAFSDPIISVYNVTSLPRTYLIVGDEILDKELSGNDAFRREISKNLR